MSALDHTQSRASQREYVQSISALSNDIERS